MHSIKLLLPVLCPLVILILSGLLGLDFGKHWDESYHLQAVKYSLENKILLPNWYHYPSVSYWLNLVGTLPDVARALGSGVRSGAELSRNLIAALGTLRHTLNVRTIFLGVSSLAVVWVYLLVLGWRRNWLEALVAACILGLSWQVGYHLRWIAPDGVMMQFAALTTLCCVFSQVRSSRQAWLRAAAIGAGLTAGTKYPGGLVFVPVLIAGAFACGRPLRARRLLSTWIELLILFVVTYLFTTPGTVLQPLSFLGGVTSEILHYASSHRNYTVAPGAAHLLGILRFAAQSLLSRYGVVSVLLSALAVLGGAALSVESRRLAALFFSFPVLYTLYFSVQRVMIVRNYLVLAPFLAVLAARGAAALWQRFPSRIGRALLGTAVGLALVANGVWALEAGLSVRERGSSAYLLGAAAYVRSHSGVRFVISKAVRNDWAGLGIQLPANATLDLSASVDDVVFYTFEDPNHKLWPANDPGLTTTCFGPWEVDLNYYPSWAGADRIVVMPLTTARRIGVMGALG